MKLSEAKKLTYRQEVWHKTLKNADGTPKRFRVNGAVKTWKRDPDRIRVPLKHGLYDTGYLVNNTFEGGRFELDISEVYLP